MNIKEKKFAEEYIITGNAEQAAIKAGYSRKTARKNAYKIVEQPNVKKYITEKINKISDEKIAKQEEVLTYLTRVMRGEETDEVLIGIGDGIQDKTKLKTNTKDRIKAAELLGKRYGTWTEKIEASQEIIFVNADQIKE